MGGEKGNAYVENNFTCWLAKRKEDLRAKAFCSAPMEFNGEWNWEVDSLNFNLFFDISMLNRHLGWYWF